ADLFALAVIGARAEGALQAGEYRLEAAVSPRAVMEQLVAGRTVVHRLTVPEGLTSAEIVALVETDDALSGIVAARPPEGSLLPETYHFARGDDRSALLARMAAEMTRALGELWSARSADLPLDTVGDALILASIIEKETGLAIERPRIAGVFVNRLRKGMRLQSDPTVVYGLTGGDGPLDRALTRADLAQAHAYNTYIIKGLPTGPIANPGRASIAAALNPEETEDLYFVADGSGGHAFARTLAEHNRNVARWRRAVKSAPPPGEAGAR
ncbi:MAG: endolytic transglycosylase MltG, partial [Alphaproteobacteria bacterium]|nr:endolytic transglycosylase MltG [Alphaproteobacteria bacterium]